jgi:hypothetical protein
MSENQKVDKEERAKIAAEGLSKDKTFKKMQLEYETCFQDNPTYAYSVISAVGAIPMGVYFKSLKPLAGGIILGTVGDFLYTYSFCDKKKKAMDEYVANMKSSVIEQEKSDLEDERKRLQEELSRLKK